MNFQIDKTFLDSQQAVPLQHLFVRLLKDGKTIRSMAKSDSMNPLIQKEDYLTVRPAGFRDLKVGDIAVYGPADQNEKECLPLTTHRIVGKSMRNGRLCLLTRPDAHGWIGEGAPVEASQIYGKVIAIERNGRMVYLDSSINRLWNHWGVRALRWGSQLKQSLKLPFHLPKDNSRTLPSFSKKSTAQKDREKETVLKTDFIYHKRPHQSVELTDGRLALIPQERGVSDMEHVFVLNKTGIHAWKLLDGTRSVADIARILNLKFDAGRAQVQKDLVRLFMHLKSIKAIADTPSSAKSKPLSALPVMIVLFLGMRLLMLLTSVESTAWEEELYRGTIAKDLIEGLKAPFWHYMADGYHSGSLVTGILAVPFFLLLGINLFALKLVPLSFSLAALILLIHFTEKHFGKKAGLYSGLLFIFAFPAFPRLTLTAMGFHTESVFFSTLLVLTFSQALLGKKHQGLWFFFAGLLGAAGFWFANITIVTLLTCLSVWLFTSPRSFLSKNFPVFLLGLFIGSIPWFLFNRSYGFYGIQYYVNMNYSEAQGWAPMFKRFLQAPVRAGVFLREGLPASFDFDSFSFVSRPVLSYGYYFLALWAVLPFYAGALKDWLIKKQGDKRLWLILLYPVFFLAVYCSSKFYSFLSFKDEFFTFRYLTPLHFFMLWILGIALSRKKAPLVTLVSLICLGLLGQSAHLFREPLGRALHYKGYSYFQMGFLWQYYFHQPLVNRDNFFDPLEGRPKEDQDALCHGISTGRILLEFKNAGELDRWAKNISVSCRIALLQQLGSKLGEEVRIKSVSLEDLSSGIPEDQKTYLFYGMAEAMADDAAEPIHEDLRRFQRFHYGRFWAYHHYFANQPVTGFQKEGLEGEAKTWFHRGVGAGAVYPFFYFDARRSLLDSLLNHFEEENYPDIFWGMGWNFREWFLEDRLRALDWVRRLPAKYQKDAETGAEAFETWHQLA